MNDLIVTIITPCFNSAKTIRKTLESILNQSYTNIEYIIVDGGSTDGTIDILREYEALFNGKMRYISETDNGIYDAMNKGIAMASGDLIGIVNSDDFYETDALANMVGAMTEDKYQVLYGYQRCVTQGIEDKIVIFHHRNLDHQMITHPTCFVTKSVYKDYGLFNLEYRSSADYEFMLRLFHETEVVFNPVYKVISNFESGGMSGSEVGVRETAKLRSRYQIISKIRYYSILIRSKLYEFKGHLLTKKKLHDA